MNNIFGRTNDLLGEEEELKEHLDWLSRSELKYENPDNPVIFSVPLTYHHLIAWNHEAKKDEPNVHNPLLKNLHSKLSNFLRSHLIEHPEGVFVKLSLTSPKDVWSRWRKDDLPSPCVTADQCLEMLLRSARVTEALADHLKFFDHIPPDLEVAVVLKKFRPGFLVAGREIRVFVGPSKILMGVMAYDYSIPWDCDFCPPSRVISLVRHKWSDTPPPFEFCTADYLIVRRGPSPLWDLELELVEYNPLKSSDEFLFRDPRTPWNDGLQILITQPLCQFRFVDSSNQTDQSLVVRAWPSPEGPLCQLAQIFRSEITLDLEGVEEWQSRVRQCWISKKPEEVVTCSHALSLIHEWRVHRHEWRPLIKDLAFFYLEHLARRVFHETDPRQVDDAVCLRVLEACVEEITHLHDTQDRFSFELYGLIGRQGRLSSLVWLCRKFPVSDDDPDHLQSLRFRLFGESLFWAIAEGHSECVVFLLLAFPSLKKIPCLRHALCLCSLHGHHTAFLLFQILFS